MAPTSASELAQPTSTSRGQGRGQRRRPHAAAGRLAPPLHVRGAECGRIQRVQARRRLKDLRVCHEGLVRGHRVEPDAQLGLTQKTELVEGTQKALEPQCGLLIPVQGTVGAEVVVADVAAVRARRAVDLSATFVTSVHICSGVPPDALRQQVVAARAAQRRRQIREARRIERRKAQASGLRRRERPIDETQARHGTRHSCEATDRECAPPRKYPLQQEAGHHQGGEVGGEVLDVAMAEMCR
mmetsp:Transcript_85029/g.274846  ORF Transcript_85029/g.274846 Transcript_85029/m.274846 type:complete len:242 (+) Transcript_85029:324-1049(+)